MPVARENGGCQTWRRFERDIQRDEVTEIGIAEIGDVGGRLPGLVCGANE